MSESGDDKTIEERVSTLEDGVRDLQDDNIAIRRDIVAIGDNVSDLREECVKNFTELRRAIEKLRRSSDPLATRRLLPDLRPRDRR